MPANLSGPTLLVILFIVLLLFGAPKLPALARSLGQSMKILKKEVSTSDKDGGDAEAASNEARPVTETPASSTDASDELAKAKAEAAALRAEADALRAQSEDSARKTEH